MRTKNVDALTRVIEAADHWAAAIERCATPAERHARLEAALRLAEAKLYTAVMEWRRASMI